MDRQDLIIVAVTDGKATDEDGMIEQLRTELEKKPNTKIVIAGFDLNDEANKELAKQILPLQDDGFQIDLARAANEKELKKIIRESLKPREYTISGRSLKDRHSAEI